MRDTWEILDPMDQVIGVVQEDSPGRALLRRFLLGSFLPQRYDVIQSGAQTTARFVQRFRLFRYELDIDFSMSPAGFDRRLGLATGILLAILEGKQHS